MLKRILQLYEYIYIYIYIYKKICIKISREIILIKKILIKSINLRKDITIKFVNLKSSKIY